MKKDKIILIILAFQTIASILMFIIIYFILTGSNDFNKSLRSYVDNLEPITIQGTKGDKGDQGETGLRGYTGDQGSRGDQGPNGQNGANGESVVGEKGDKGDTGPQGAQGEPGQNGREVEFQCNRNSMNFEYRYVGDEDWQKTGAKCIPEN